MVDSAQLSKLPPREQWQHWLPVEPRRLRSEMSGSGLIYPHSQVHSKFPASVIPAFITFTAFPLVLMLKLNWRNIWVPSLTSTWSTEPQLPLWKLPSPPCAEQAPSADSLCTIQGCSTNVSRFLSSVPGARWHSLRFIMIVFDNLRHVSPLKASAWCWFSKLTLT